MSFGTKTQSATAIVVLVASLTALLACTGGDSDRHADISNPDLLWLMGVRAYQGEINDPDPAQAARYYEQAAKLGSGEAKLALSYFHQSGIGIPKDEARSEALRNDAIEILWAGATPKIRMVNGHFLAWLMKTGLGFPADPDGVRTWRIKSGLLWSQDGRFDAAEYLSDRAFLHMDREHHTEQQRIVESYLRLSEKLFLEQANKGDMISQLKLARRYYLGLDHTGGQRLLPVRTDIWEEHPYEDRNRFPPKGFAIQHLDRRDLGKAAYWFAKAAAKNSAAGNLALSVLHRQGVGGTRDSKLAEDYRLMATRELCPFVPLRNGDEPGYERVEFDWRPLRELFFDHDMAAEWRKKSDECPPYPIPEIKEAQPKTFKLAPS